MKWLLEKILFILEALFELGIFLLMLGLWLAGGVLITYNGFVSEYSELPTIIMICAYAAFIGVPIANLYIVDNQCDANYLVPCFAIGGPVFVLIFITCLLLCLVSSANPVDLIPALLCALLVGAIGRYQMSVFW
jgi:hypothetical protein